MNSDYVNSMNMYDQPDQNQMYQVQHSQSMHQMHNMDSSQMNQNNNLIQMQQHNTPPISIQPSSPHHLQHHHLSHLHPQHHHPQQMQQQQQMQHSSPQNPIHSQFQQVNQYHQPHYHQSHSTPPSPHNHKHSLPPSPFSPHTGQQTTLQKQLSVISPSHHYQLSPSNTSTNNNISYFQNSHQLISTQNSNQPVNKMINPLIKGQQNMISLNSANKIDDNNKIIHNTTGMVGDISKIPNPKINNKLNNLSNLVKQPIISQQNTYQVIQPQQQQANVLQNNSQSVQIQKLKSSFQQNQVQTQQNPQLSAPVSYFPANSTYQMIESCSTLQSANTNNMKSPISGSQTNQQFLKTNNTMLTSPTITTNSPTSVANINIMNGSSFINNSAPGMFFNSTRAANIELSQNNLNSPIFCNNNVNISNNSTNIMNTNSNSNKSSINNITNNFTGLEKHLVNGSTNKQSSDLVSNKTEDLATNRSSSDDFKISTINSSENKNIDNNNIKNIDNLYANGLLGAYNVNQINNLINSPLTEEEEEILSEYDCRLYGLLKLENAENVFKKLFIVKAILCYEKRIVTLTEENFSEILISGEDKRSKINSDLTKCKYIQLAKLYLSLGHFYLLIYEYSKALECYQKFFKFRINKLQDSTFYYGIGLVYFVYGAFKYAARSLLCALYKDTNFQRVNEIHFRLGIIYKELNNFVLSLKHFKLALIDTSSSLSSVTKSAIKLCIAQLFETNSEIFEAIEKYEDLARSEISDANSTNFVDNHIKAKAYRHLGWIYYYSDCLNSSTNTDNPISPYKLESKPQTNKQKQILSSKSLQLTLENLGKSAQLDSAQNLTWYYLGRALACKGNSREAFISYKNSVNNPEANGDTWCSIGILYFQQKQFMDSLQAFICAIQLDRSHFSAWLNLGILYEQDNQLDEALKCYKSAAKCRVEVKRKKLRTDKVTESNEGNHEIDELDSEDDSSSSKEELKLLKERTKLINTYLELPEEKRKEFLKDRTHSLPILEDAFSLQIPTELRQKILNSNHYNQSNISLGINCNINNDFKNQHNSKLKANISPNNNESSPNSSSDLKHNKNNRILTNLTANTSPSITQLTQQQQQHIHNNLNQEQTSEQLAKRVKLSKKADSQIFLKPQQIQLMYQLEQNRNQLNPEQMLMLNHLKSQYAAAQQQNLASNQQFTNVNSNDQLKNNSFILNPQHANRSLHLNSQGNLFGPSSSFLNCSLDQLPKDLENVQPITMTQDDNALQDLNTLLSRHDIVEDLRISDDDKGSLDHIFSFTNSNSKHPSFFHEQNFTHPIHSKIALNELNDDSNSSNSSESSTFLDRIKLDSSLTNGDNKLSSQSLMADNSKDKVDKDELLKTTLLLPVTDDEVLASKLNIKMNAQQILNECKSYGVNGIQTNSFLRPRRLINNRKKLYFQSEDNIESSNSDEDQDEIDDTLPNGSLGPDSIYLRNHHIDSKKTKLNPSTPSVLLETKKDAQSSHLQYFCLSHPISVVRGLGNVLKLDLGLFSTKSLVEVDSEHQVEVRKQRLQSSNENWDIHGKIKNVWKCESSRSYTTLVKYAQYQAHSFQEAIKEEKSSNSNENDLNILKNQNLCKQINNSRRKDSLDSATGNLFSPGLTVNTTKKSFKTIKFGTNVDLSDENKWKIQIQELAKLPAFMRVISSGNMLSHIGYKVYGVNTIQMYLKVPGCRTPGHQENNNFCSLNINIGPGDCEWFGVDEKYWPIIEELCEKNDVDYLNGSWWPNLEDLSEANIPVYRFLQKPGDLVWVNAGCIHWVQSVGWCNHISWNVGPLVYLQYKLAIERYEWNKLKFYKSIVPMVHLSWNMARNIKIQDRRLYEYIRYVLMQSLKQCQLAINYIENCGCEMKFQARQLDEPAHYCYDCECEVFNILFVSEQAAIEQGNKKTDKIGMAVQHVVHCQACARKRSHLLENFVILNQYNMEDLKNIFDQFQLYVQSVSSINSPASPI